MEKTNFLGAPRTNDSILQKTDVKERLIQKIYRMQFTYLGHISRRDPESLEKQIMIGLVERKGNVGDLVFSGAMKSQI